MSTAAAVSASRKFFPCASSNKLCDFWIIRTIQLPVKQTVMVIRMMDKLTGRRSPNDRTKTINTRCSVRPFVRPARLIISPHLDQVEPGGVFGREGKFEAACRLFIEPSFGSFRDVCGMIVENQLDGGAGRIGRIEQLKEFDELAAAVAVLDERADLACQISSSQQAECAMTLIFKIAREGRIDAWHGGKSGAVVAIAWIPGFSS